MFKALFQNFIESYLPGSPPLLLGLSGGPDSMALYHLLLEHAYPFEVAHVDHGWREESQGESLYLKKMCDVAKIPFHLECLAPPKEKKNLEDQGRVARLHFFKKTIEERNLNGVLLAHHADDHAETVLKRIFEGATLPKLKGLAPQSAWEGVKVYRPFLKLRKKEIVSWLSEKKCTYFQDATNQDPRFLRSRMRLELIPMLSNTFGKEIALNLCRLGERAAELEDFLNELSLPYLERVKVSEESISLDFSMHPPQSDFLWKTILRKFFEQVGISVSTLLIESILSHLQKGSCHKKLKVGARALLIHKMELKIK